MDEFVVTSIQQQIRVFESHGEFRNDIQRFMRLAKIKESHLVVFPELCGLLLAPPLVPGLKRTLLRVAERQVKKKPSLIDRMVGRLANSATDALGGIGGQFMETFTSRIDTLRDAYLTIFSETAREYEMYILAGSIYLPDSRDGQTHNTAYLFSPTGEVIGQQSKIVLGYADTLVCKPATTGLEVFETDFGKLGILIGQDSLFPESARILGALGATGVIHLVAADGQSTFSKLRNAFAARLQENLLLGAESCLVGKNIISPKHEANDYMGKSAIMAPAEMTTRYSGLLGEVGSMVTDGIISAVWDLKGLYELRNTISIAVNEPLRNEVLRRQMRTLYAEPIGAPAPAALRAKPEATDSATAEVRPSLAPEAPVIEEAAEETTIQPVTVESAPSPEIPALPPSADETAIDRLETLPPLPLVYDVYDEAPTTLPAPEPERPVQPSPEPWEAQALPARSLPSEEAPADWEENRAATSWEEASLTPLELTGPEDAVEPERGEDVWPRPDSEMPWGNSPQSERPLGSLTLTPNDPTEPADTDPNRMEAAESRAAGASSPEPLDRSEESESTKEPPERSPEQDSAWKRLLRWRR